MAAVLVPTGKESRFEDNEIIVSKTSLSGKIIYANDVFLRVSGFTPEELLGAPHNIIRHPEMPRSIFKLFWDTIRGKDEIFAYVLNMAKNGDHYWVLAHVTPSFDGTGAHVGYHSNRRKAEPGAVAAIEPLYRMLRGIERRSGDTRQGMIAAADHLSAILDDKGVSYDQFVFSL